MRKLSLLPLAFLTACVSTTPITLPGGSRGFAIECRHAGACYNAAANACAPQTYDIVDKDGYLVGAIVAGQGRLVGATRHETSFAVKCVSP